MHLYDIGIQSYNKTHELRDFYYDLENLISYKYTELITCVTAHVPEVARGPQILPLPDDGSRMSRKEKKW